MYAAAKMDRGSAGGGSDYESPSGGDLTMGGSIVRIDVSKGAKHVVTFVNNLEKDSMYARWPRALKQLSYPTWSLHSIQVCDNATRY